MNEWGWSEPQWDISVWTWAGNLQVKLSRTVCVSVATGDVVDPQATWSIADQLPTLGFPDQSAQPQTTFTKTGFHTCSKKDTHTQGKSMWLHIPQTLRRQQSGVSWKERDTLAFQQPETGQVGTTHTHSATHKHTLCPCCWHQPKWLLVEPLEGSMYGDSVLRYWRKTV